jgi:hypothetical protein
MAPNRLEICYINKKINKILYYNFYNTKLYFTQSKTFVIFLKKTALRSYK